MFARGVFCLMSLVVLACGVKGDPVPPTKGVDIGSGKPIILRSKEKSSVPVKTYKEDEAEEENEEKKK
jgi:hypothetical protein